MYQNVNNSLELWNNTRIYEIFYTLNVGPIAIKVNGCCKTTCGGFGGGYA
jgi:hypothetical protein